MIALSVGTYSNAEIKKDAVTTNVLKQLRIETAADVGPLIAPSFAFAVGDGVVGESVGEEVGVSVYVTTHASSSGGLMVRISPGSANCKMYPIKHCKRAASCVPFGLIT